MDWLRASPSELRIVSHPDPVLRQRAAVIDLTDSEATSQLRKIADRMVALMHEASGVGLAAPQVGLPIRMFVANWTQDPGDDHVFVNPELFDPAPNTESAEEGCLSLPEIRVEVTRPTAVGIRAIDLNGDAFEQVSDGFAARVWQHEFDHLEGRLITDRMSLMDRVANRRALKALGFA